MIVCLCGTSKAAKLVGGLERIIRGIVPDECFRVYYKIKDFAQRLRDPRKSTNIAVLVANDEQEILEFAALRELSDCRIILILNTGELDMIRMGHMLRPRFLAPAYTDLELVGLVLRKMIGITASK